MSPATLSVGMLGEELQVSIPSVPLSRAAQQYCVRNKCSQPLYNKVTDKTEVLGSVTDLTESKLIVFNSTVGGQIMHILADTSAS